MTFDTIAFTQDELDNALNLCCTSIGLCDNDFILPQIAGVTYISIGEISAKAKFKKDDMKKLRRKTFFSHSNTIRPTEVPILRPRPGKTERSQMPSTPATASPMTK